MARFLANDIGHSYEVWCEREAEFGDGAHSELVASFRYFQEALDYRDYAGERGVMAVARSVELGAAYPYRRAS